MKDTVGFMIILYGSITYYHLDCVDWCNREEDVCIKDRRRAKLVLLPGAGDTGFKIICFDVQLILGQPGTMYLGEVMVKIVGSGSFKIFGFLFAKRFAFVAK